MKKTKSIGFLLIIIGICFSYTASAQVDHWESVIIEGDEWSYLVPNSEPNSNWRTLGFNANSWNTGKSGFGYGDGDDNVILPRTISVYIRKVFNIVDKSAIEKAILSMDYDDGFVAYLNGTEIARSTLLGNPPAYNQRSDGLHEALLYRGGVPESFTINPSLLNNGNNVLAIQVHNESLTSSDLTAIPILSVGINNSTMNYKSTPIWFQPILDFTSSNLPIVVINTNGQNIVDEPKVNASIGIIYNGEGVMNNLSDPPNEYSGLCGIEFRGESSQSFAKKSFGFEIRDVNGNDQDTSFLNFPSEEDFILYGPYSDKSLLNNVLAMKLANDFGHYSSRTRLVELVINDEYRGVYVIMEKIKRDNDRVDIAKLGTTEISGDDLTGGYIFRIDKGFYDGWFSKYNKYASGSRLYFQFYYPNQDNIQPEQKAYIKNYMDAFEAAIASPSFKNAEGKHYTEYINLRSFVDNFILNELSKDVDAYRLSTYFHKDKDSKGGKITAGPFWDFNLAFGNGDYCSGDDVTGWEYYQCPGNSPFWWDAMLQDTLFTNALRCRWEELRSTTLSTANMNHYLDSISTNMNDAQARNFQKWPVMGTYIWPNPAFYANSQDHAEVMGHMKNWIADRSNWLDDNIPGIAQFCENYVTSIPASNIYKPEITVYPNPATTIIYIKSQEPIEEITLTNNLGQAFYQEQFKTASISIELDGNIPKGIYWLSAKTKMA